MIHFSKGSKMVKNIVFPAVSAIMLVLASGCSLFVAKTQTITIDGKPSGAEVVVNGIPYTPPCEITVPRNKKLDIDIMKDGYYPETMHSSYSLSTTGVLDMVGAYFFLIPAVGFFSDGAFSLDQLDFRYELDPIED